MKLEEFGAPLPNESPERRYASLHRTIESGLANDKVWNNLVHTCLTLHKPDEALTAVGYINDSALRERTQRILLAAGAHGQQTVRPASGTRMHVPRPDQVARAEDSIAENVVDSFRFLFSDQMPLTVIFATLMFPLVVGLGGFLTRDSHAMLFPLIAMIPALSVVGLIGALGRRITLDASRGIDDPPTIPPTRELVRDALRFLVDATVLGTVFLGPGIACLAMDAVGTVAAVSTLALGVFLLPMAMGIRQMSTDWRALSPNVLFPAIMSCGQRYAAVAVAAAVLFAPAGFSAWFSAGSQIYLQVSVVGPLMVAPLFVIARLLGQTLHHHRRDLVKFFGIPKSQAERIVSATATVNSSRPLRELGMEDAPQASTRGAPLHEGSTHPEARRTPPRRQEQKQSAQARPAQARTSKASPAKARPAKARPADSRPERTRTTNTRTTKSRPTTAAERSPASESRPKPVPPARTVGGSNRPAARGDHPQRRQGVPASQRQPDEGRPRKSPPHDKSMPDLSNMPGARIIAGADRARAGASSGRSGSAPPR